MQVLLLRPDKAGDALKTLPVIRALQGIAPQFHLNILCSPHNASLFEFEPNLKTYVLPRDWENKSSEELQTVIDGLGLHTPFDTVVNLLCDSFPEIDRLVLCLNSARYFIPKFSVGPARREESLNIAELVSQALKVDLLPEILTAPRPPILGPNDEAESLHALGQKGVQRWVGFCPFAGMANRTHPFQKWKAFFAHLRQESVPKHFFLFGGPADLLALNELKSLAPTTENLSVITPSSFRALGAFLKRMDGVVAVDSGPLHYALALGVPVLGFLSGGDQKRWFGRTGPKDKLLPRGIFSRYPSPLEMRWAYKNWVKQL